YDRRHRVGLADVWYVGLRIVGVGRVEAHDALIFLAPPLLHFFELGLADHILDAGGEMPRHAAHPADPISDGAHDLGQIFGADEYQREDGDDRKLAGIDAEHDGALSARQARGSSSPGGGATGSAGRGVTSIGSCGRAGSRGSWRGSARRCSSWRRTFSSSSSAMPCLKLLRPLATSPIIDEKRFPPNSSRRM